MTLFLGALLPLFLGESFNADFSFPEDVGIVDVTKAPYLADPTDNNNHDDTNAILQALADHAGEGKIIYLPNGVYNISGPIEFPKGQPGWKWSGNRLQGQSTESTVIKLIDNAEGFANSTQPQAVIRTTGIVEDWHVAQRFNNDLSHLTIQTGRGNAGAIGLQFMSNNTGILEAVKVISNDGQGTYGVDFGFANENGPLLVKNLSVDGFDVGIYTSYALNSQTFENIALLNQNKFGWENQGQRVAVRNLSIDNPGAEAVQSTGGNFVLIDGTFLNGTAEKPAINLSDGYAYIRNVTATGYQQILASQTPSGSVDGAIVEEYVSHAVLKSSSDSATSSLNLPVEETPTVPWESPSEWANIKDFGATETDRQPDDNDDQLAIQQAINSGAKTIYFPNSVRGSYPWKPGDYDWNTVTVGGNVERLIGTEAQRPFTPGTFVIDEVGPPVIIFERLNNIKIINNTNRTVIVKNSAAKIEASGSGKTFLEDVVTGGTTSIQVSNGHTLYARQLNPEWNGNEKPGSTPIIDNDGAIVWILGMKNETGGTIVRTRNGGKTEILGGHQYVIGTPEGGNNNMFVVENADFSITSIETNLGGGSPYSTYLKETRNGITREISRDDIPYNGTGNAKAFPLLVTNYSASLETSTAVNKVVDTTAVPKELLSFLSTLSLSFEKSRMKINQYLGQLRTTSTESELNNHN